MKQEKRNQEIFGKRQQGKSNNELAREYNLTPQRISKIFQAELNKQRKQIIKEREKI